jgi:hypothetical protein
MMAFTTFFSRAAGGVPGVYFTNFIFIIVLAFVGFRMYKRFSSRQPVLIFNSDGLQIPGKKNSYIRWDDITEWKIRTNKGSHLIIRTSTGKTRIEITWLDHPVSEIQRLMETYIRQPGPVFPGK